MGSAVGLPAIATCNPSHLLLPISASTCYLEVASWRHERVHRTESEAPQIPAEPAPPIQSRFLFVDVAALRAKQLRRGARVALRAETVPLPHKAERVAMEEVRRGLVYYDVPARTRSRCGRTQA